MRRSMSGMLLAVFFVSGCSTLGLGGSNGQEKTKAELPAWVKNPPSDSPFDLYGIGEGRNIAGAKDAALSDIAGKLSTWVQSSTKGSSTKYAGETSRSFQKDIQTRIQGLKLNNYQVEKTAEVGKQTMVLLRVDREAVFRNTRSRLKDLDKQIRQVFKSKSQAPLIRRFAAYQSQTSDIGKAQRLVQILKALDAEFDGSSFLSRYRQYRQNVNELRDDLRVRIEPTANTQKLAERLAGLLMEEGVNAGLKGDSGQANGVIRFDDRLEKEKLFGSQTVKLHVWISISDKGGHEVVKTDFQSSGSSPSGYPVALQSANRKMAKSMEKQGVLRSLKLVE